MLPLKSLIFFADVYTNCKNAACNACSENAKGSLRRSWHRLPFWRKCRRKGRQFLLHSRSPHGGDERKRTERKLNISGGFIEINTRRLDVLRQASLCFSSIPPLTNPHALVLVLRHYVQSSPHLFDRSSMAKQNLSHRANVICDGSPSRIRMVRRISLGMTTRPRSSACVK